MAVAGVPDEMKEKIAEMEQTCLLREVPDEPEKFFMKYECGEVRIKTSTFFGVLRNKFLNFSCSQWRTVSSWEWSTRCTTR